MTFVLLDRGFFILYFCGHQVCPLSLNGICQSLGVESSKARFFFSFPSSPSFSISQELKCLLLVLSDDVMRAMVAFLPTTGISATPLVRPLPMNDVKCSFWGVPKL